MPRRDEVLPTLDKVLELVVLLSDDMERSFARDGLTAARAHLLWVLREQGPSTQRALAQALDVSARNVTGLVDALVATGFVTREPHPGDRRATLVTFTEHGAAVVSEMASGQLELADLLFGGMSRTQLDCFDAGLTGLLDRLRARLREEVRDDVQA
jgi:DNA-binding MarR family transcriptional regulator